MLEVKKRNGKGLYDRKWRIGVGKDFSDELVCNLILEYLYEKGKLE
jgi:stalled ribosome alternative rescue factor ArfA